MKEGSEINEYIFNKTKEDGEKFYKNIKNIYCPYLKVKVSFNAKGLEHIKMKNRNKSRTKSDQYLRLKFLKLIPYILSKSGTLQEFNNRGGVKYFGFIAIVNNIRLKIIIKKKNNNNPYFWSIIPFWKKERDEISQKIKKVFHEGDLKSD
jgi:hypothetical protein